jgi:hypothetical protein
MSAQHKNSGAFAVLFVLDYKFEMIFRKTFKMRLQEPCLFSF